LNASDERGIAVVREKIVHFASSQGLHDMMSETGGKQQQIKLVILDEVIHLFKT
jgi:DNA polymerase III delta prime subunit